VTLGCKVNQYETQLVKETLAQNGFREAREGEAADLCVVNTCTVTATGDSKGRQAIRQLSRANPATQTIVMGCYATRDPKTVASLPGVVEVVTDKRELPDVLARFGIYDMPAGISSFDGRQRAFVKVQDGCILKCTYCIIPQVRPGLRSRDPQDIEDEVRRLIDNGYREIVLSGIHVGHFGVETTRGKSGKPPFRLWHLFEKLDRIPGAWRMRLSSIEAAEIHDDFLKAARNCEHLCPHFHPSLQSGSNAVLRRMRRRYSVERFLEKCERIREVLPNAALTTDVIVGFPGETEDDFEETVAACRRAEFMKVHVFPFSAREGTPAAGYADQVSPDVLKARCDRLASEERALARRYYDTWVGQSVEVLIEREIADRPNWVRGTDRRYVPVTLPGSSDDVGRLVTARAVQAGVRGLVAEPMFSKSKERADDSPGIPIDLCRSPAGRGNDDRAFPP
jgi:threonylcarbamoyladenosine tRNA methylthiotransferase MtaB